MKNICSIVFFSYSFGSLISLSRNSIKCCSVSLNSDGKSFLSDLQLKIRNKIIDIRNFFIIVAQRANKPILLHLFLSNISESFNKTNGAFVKRGPGVILAILPKPFIKIFFVF